MSDNLETLPQNPNTKVTPKEEEILSRFFPRKDASGGGTADPSPTSDLKSWKSCFKLTLYALVIVILLYNPFTGSVLSGISYFASPINFEVFRVLAFGISFLFVYKYLFKSS